MPRLIKSARAKPGSNPPADPLPKAAPPIPQFTESSQQNSSSGPDRPENSPDLADGPSPEESPKEKLPEEKLPEEELSPENLSLETLSLETTEPFPPDLFRVPVPNAVFSEMPELSDSALRCLLALIDLSFRFDPAESEWVHTEKWLTRSGVETECGLSSQGTRNGLSELESIGWAKVDRSGQGHRYRLTLEVPSRRFTYVPTALLERASGIASGTELRVLLAVLRGTWGWTDRETDPESGDLRVVHDRWARLSNRELAEATGRSETAVGEAAAALQGRWIERVRPGSGPYQYRFLPKAVRDSSGNGSGDGPGDEDSFCGPTSNDLAPDRQKSGTPTSVKETSPKDKHSRSSKSAEAPRERASSSGRKNAVRAETNPEGENDPEAENSPERMSDRQKRSNREQNGREQNRQERDGQKRNRQKQNGGDRGESPTPDSSGLPPEKQDLARKLENVGVWAGRIAELLSRFSLRRIRANFELYRKRAAGQTIRKPGAWLHEAITEGYALPDGKSGNEGSGQAGRPAPDHKGPDHKETVSEAEKDAYVAQGLDEKRFRRCLSPGGSSEPKFMYFTPEEGGPGQRV